MEKFRKEFDRYRSAIVNEPRGSDVTVGALLVEPEDKSCAAGVIYFNNVGYLGMCGHGTIGLMVMLAHLGKIGPGTHRIETVVGVVSATLHEDWTVSVENVASYRKAKGAVANVPGLGTFKGDVSWGGNWFYLVNDHGQELALSNVDRLTEVAWKIRQAINAQGYPDVDHVELFGKPTVEGAKSKSFVLCPGKAYDRSPCGTGTSAKLACLAADGKLAEGEEWVQESVIGSTFKGKFRWEGETRNAKHETRNEGEGPRVIPTITGSAFVNAESVLVLGEGDPFCWGIR
jgi:4-hydroxyproline epimerase